VNETLHFLLDHPRRYVRSPSLGLALPPVPIFTSSIVSPTPYLSLDNGKHELIIRCFLYLFPSHQTWFLVFLLVVFM